MLYALGRGFVLSISAADILLAINIIKAQRGAIVLLSDQVFG